MLHVVSVHQINSVPSHDLHAPPATEARPRWSGFWAVAFAFLVVMAFATLPSPLYGLYRARDGLSQLTVTVVYAVFAAGTIATLLLLPAIAVRVGRRVLVVGAVATMMVAAGVLATWKDLPGLLIGRLITGVVVGLAAGTALTYLIELRVRQDPNASVTRVRNIGTAVNIGALGIGPLIAGCLAAWVARPLTAPYLLFMALGAVALIGLATAPETRTAAPPALAGNQASDSRGSVRVLGPGIAAALAAFSANGLFAGLSGLFLATTFHHSSPALSGATLFLVFSSGVVSQLATDGLPARRVFVLGTIFLLTGLVALVTSVRLSTPSLALFLVSGSLIGAGVGAVFKGTTGLVLEATSPDKRLATISHLQIALIAGLSIPVIGAGLALNQGASAADTVFGFAIFVGSGVAGAGALLGHRLRTAQ